MTRTTTPPSSCAAVVVTVVPGRAVLGGIAQQVAHDLLEVEVLAEDQGQAGRDVQLEAVARPAGGLAVHGPAQDVAHEQRILGQDQPATLGPAQDQQVLGQPPQPVRLGLDVVERLGEGRRLHRGVALGEHPAHAVDGRDRRAQLVADDAHEGVAHAPGALLVGVARGQVDGAGQGPGDGRQQALLLGEERPRLGGIHLEQADADPVALDGHGQPRADVG